MKAVLRLLNIVRTFRAYNSYIKMLKAHPEYGPLFKELGKLSNRATWSYMIWIVLVIFIILGLAAL